MKVEYDCKGQRKIAEIDNNKSEAERREREYILYTYLSNTPESTRKRYIYSIKTFLKKANNEGLIRSDNIINPFNIKYDNIQFCEDILENIKNVESYYKIDNEIMHNATRTFLGNYFIDFIKNFIKPQIWWLSVNKQTDYWKKEYPLDKWQLGTNNDMIVYEYRDNIKEGDIAIFYFTNDIKAVRYIGRVYKIDEYIHFDMLLKIEKGFDLQKIRNIDGLENYPPQGGFSKMGNQQIALELVIKCFENGQLQQNMAANQNLKENELVQKGDIMQKNKTPPLNQILYGPPGTGKTYSTIDKALEILHYYGEIDSIPEERKDKKALFDKYCKGDNRQIEFVTFHQSFSYEEFVEGIKPQLTNSSEGTKSSEMSYTIKSGIFKEICDKAKQNTKEFVTNQKFCVLDKNKTLWRLYTLPDASIDNDFFDECIKGEYVKAYYDYGGVALNKEAQSGDYIVIPKKG